MTYGHKIGVMTERVRLQIQVAEMSSLHWVVGLSLRDRVRSSERDQSRATCGLWIWLRYLLGASLWRCSGHAQLVADLFLNPLDRLYFSCGLGTPWYPQGGTRNRLDQGCLEYSAYNCFGWGKMMDGWILRNNKYEIIIIEIHLFQMPAGGQRPNIFLFASDSEKQHLYCVHTTTKDCWHFNRLLLFKSVLGSAVITLLLLSANAKSVKARFVFTPGWFWLNVFFFLIQRSTAVRVCVLINVCLLECVL